MSDGYKTMRLSIVSQESIFSRPNGSTLYRVEALDEKGDQVPDLRTFAEKLPTLDYQEFKLKRYEHPEHGVTWTILDPSGGPSKTPSDVERRLASLERRVKTLEAESKSDVHPAQSDDEVRGPDFFS
jgi:hypothetical protein